MRQLSPEDLAGQAHRKTDDGRGQVSRRKGGAATSGVDLALLWQINEASGFALEALIWVDRSDDHGADRRLAWGIAGLARTISGEAGP